MDAGPVLGKTTTTITSAGRNPAFADDDSTGRHKLQDKLLPRSITGSRRWKRTSQPPGAQQPEQEQEQTLPSRTSSSSLSTSTDQHGRRDSRRDSRTDMLRGRSRRRNAAAADAAGEDDSGRSEDDISHRPRTISSHPSQIGHLTTSSPLVQADHLQDIRTPAASSDDTDRFSRASTFHPEPAQSTLPSPSRKSSSTLEPSAPSLSTSKTGLAPPTSKLKNRRAPSPAGRFRNVFKKKSPAASIASVESQSPERPRPSNPDDANTAFPTVHDDAPTPTPVIRLPSDAHSHTPDISKVAPTERFRRLSRGQKVDTVARPETPPATADNSPPVIVNTPPTPTESNRPDTTIARPKTAVAASRDSSSHSSGFGSSPSSPNSLGSSMLAQRRSRAGSASLVPSKLSNYTLAPLTPTPENGPNTPSASGFFSTVISAAQNATNSLSSSITPWSNPGKKSPSGKDQDDKSASSTAGADDDHSRKEDDEVEVESSLDPSLAPTESSGSKEPAIKTLGEGDLSLSHLGLGDQASKANSTATGANSAAVAALTSALSSSNTAAMGTQSPVVTSQRVSRVSIDSRNRSESAPPDSSQFHVPSESNDQGSEGSFPAGGQPGSVSDFAGHDTPPAASLYGDKIDPVQRTSSIRSAIGRRRNRGSSAVSGGTIAAAIASANASLAHPTTNGSTPKLTGFAVASKKRNRDFHNLFKSVPDDDYLIEDYSCALQREILAHGRLYVSEGHLCFSSNILGWVTTLVMSFDEIVSVEKRSTALVFKNGLMISTLHAKHIFASFASRDSTYDLIVKIWKLGHPSLQSSVNGVHIDETGGDKTEKIDEGDAEEASAGSRSASESEEESDDDSNDVYDEDDDEDELLDAAHSSDLSGGSGGAGDGEADKVVTRKVSGPAGMAGAGAGGGGGGANGGAADKSKDAPAASAAGGAGGAEFPGPLTHAPTDCGDSSSHYDKILADEVVPAPLGKVFSYMFGNASVTFMPKWLSSDQKCFDIQMGDRKGLSQENKIRTFSYIKPLNASIGPKQTKCMVTEQIEVLDYEKAIHIMCSTQNPDVPNGNIFTVKTKYCLSWGEGNGTRVQMNCFTEWTGKSWIKVPIEKAANEGQAQYGRDLFAGLKEALSSRSRAATVPAKGAAAAKPAGKKGRKSKTAQATSGTTSDSDRAKTDASRKGGASTASDWGMLEPVHGILGPVVDIVQPLLTGNVMYGLLVGLLVVSWFGYRGGNGDSGVGAAGPVAGGPRHPYFPDRGYYADRVVAYDEMWRREESELWDWLEERVGLDRLGKSDFASSSAEQQHRQQQKKQQYQQRQRVDRNVQDKLRDERMDEREIREAIRVTEEKLRVLKEVVEKREL